MKALMKTGTVVSVFALMMFAQSGRVWDGVSVVAAANAAAFVVEPRLADGDVKAVDAQVYDAIAARDATKLSALLDDGFLLTNTFGTVYDKSSFLKACCTEPATSQTSLKSADMQVKTYGDTAVVFARTEMRFVKDNQNQQIAWRSMRVYVRPRGGPWKLVGEQRTGVS